MSKAEFVGTFSLVTGASSGLGVEFAHQIAQRGGNVVLVARRLELLEKVAAGVREKHGVDARVYQVDLSLAGAGQALVSLLEQDGIEVEHLVNNAGFGDAAPIAEQSVKKYQDMLHVNCMAVTELVTILLPRMKQNNRGGVLTVASLVGFMPMPFMSVYAASKAYVRSFMMGLAVELKGTQVRSLALCPGRVPTDFEASAGFLMDRGWVPGQLTARETVRRALRAYDRRRSVYVSGFANALLTVLVRILPAMLMSRINGAVVKKALELG